jgi:hypothetical protein
MEVKAAQSTLIYAHVRRDLVEAGASTQTLLDDVNAKVVAHGGIILSNNQFLRRPIEMNWSIDTYLDDYTSAPFEHPDIEWGEAQRRYFGELWGLTDPYSYARDREAYNQFCVSARDPTPYLVPDEVIYAMIETVGERRAIDCPCHHTQVVYTSRHRLLCMGCGQLYRVLAEPLDHVFEHGITNDQWESAFDDDGELIDDEIHIPIVDYRTVEKAPYIWTTDARDEATWLIHFYAEGSEEEIKRYEASQPKAEDFIAAGWVEIPSPPSVSAQLAGDGVDIDLWSNSEVAVKAAARAYAQSRTKPEALRDAVLNCFQAIELVLKMRLETIDPGEVKGNNPTVLRRLIDHGVAINADEIATIDALRKLRNKLQHAGASFGYRDTRRLLRAAFTFLDRFTIDELDLWISHVCDLTGWRSLLHIAPIKANAEKISTHLIARVDSEPTINAVVTCEACGRERMVVFDTGFRNCMYCHEEWHPKIEDDIGDDADLPEPPIATPASMTGLGEQEDG